MKITVLVFAKLKDAFKSNELLSHVNGSPSVSEFVRDLFTQYKLDHLKDLPLMYAVNGQYVDASQLLQDQDEVAILPPVCGG